MSAGTCQFCPRDIYLNGTDVKKGCRMVRGCPRDPKSHDIICPRQNVCFLKKHLFSHEACMALLASNKPCLGILFILVLIKIDLAASMICWKKTKNKHCTQSRA